MSLSRREERLSVPLHHLTAGEISSQNRTSKTTSIFSLSFSTFCFAAAKKKKIHFTQSIKTVLSFKVIDL